MAGERIVLYGPGGVGKTSLCALAPKPCFVDLNRGLRDGNVASVSADDGAPLVTTWEELLACLRSDVFDEYQTIVIEMALEVQKLAEACVLRTIKSSKGERVARIEGYGWGEGWQHVYDTFFSLLPELDRHAQAGRHSIITAHNTVRKAPNPAGEDYVRDEPAFNQPPTKGRIGDLVFGWADDVLFFDFDRHVSEGKAVSAGTRAVHPIEQAHFRAKSRTLREPVVIQEGSDELWRRLFAGGAA